MKTQTIDHWEKQYAQQMKRYPEIQECLKELEDHIGFLLNATTDLTQTPRRGFRTLEQQREDGELSPFERGTQRRSKRAYSLLKSLKTQVEQIAAEVKRATQRLPRLPG